MSHREAILDAALTLFSEKGYAATTTAQIASLAGTAEGTIFHHFGHKDRLFLAVVARIRAEVEGALREVVESGGFRRGLELFDAVIALIFLMSERHRREFKLLLRGYIHELALEDEEARRQVEALYEAFVSAIAEAIAQGVEDGSIRRVRPEREAMMILGMIMGVIRFEIFGLWASTQAYRDAREFCRRALASDVSPSGGP